jgi:hypothetical protein
MVIISFGENVMSLRLIFLSNDKKNFDFVGNWYAINIAAFL